MLQVLSLIHQKVSTPSSRYRLVVIVGENNPACIQVIDCERGHPVFDWSGYIARHLLNSDALQHVDPKICRCYPCNKDLVCHLALVAAAARSVAAMLSPAHEVVAKVLLENPLHHHTAEDVSCLMAVEGRTIAEMEVEKELDDMAGSGIIQRITVDNDNVFYDINTRPHEHVFDPATRTLRDA